MDRKNIPSSPRSRTLPGLDTFRQGWAQYNSLDQQARRKNTPILWLRCQQCLAAIFIGLFTPIWALLYLSVKLTSKGPFLYKQQRQGLHGDLFWAYKIRTMQVGADKDKTRAITVEKDDPAITPIGKILRDLKLDEMPQLFNVVRGEMEFIGPRPIAPALQEDLEQKIPGFIRRKSVRPGLSSLAQICIFHNAEAKDMLDDWTTRFQAELHYLKQKSWPYDLLIMAMTAVFILRKIIRKLPFRPMTALRQSLKMLVIAGCALLLAACSGYMNTNSFKKADQAYTKDIPAYGMRYDPAVTEIQPVKINGLNGDLADPIYRLGSGDIIKINIFGEEGLSDMILRVDGSGAVQLPYLETVQVGGLSLFEVQQKLKKSFENHFKNPWVVVNIINHKSRPVYLLGQFRKPGVVYLTGPTNLTQAISLGQGLSDLAHLRGARLWRKGAIAPVDLHAVLMEGKQNHNIGLMAGDTIFVPSKKDRKAFIMGAVTRPGSVAFDNHPMTLLSALSEVGGPIKEKALMSQVRIIRSHSPLEGQLILVNVNKMLRGKVADFQLMPDDIVYVPDNPIENWNQMIRAVSPTLQLAGGVLQPFVQIKFLKGE